MTDVFWMLKHCLVPSRGEHTSVSPRAFRSRPRFVMLLGDNHNGFVAIVLKEGAIASMRDPEDDLYFKSRMMDQTLHHSVHQ